MFGGIFSFNANAQNEKRQILHFTSIVCHAAFSCIPDTIVSNQVDFYNYSTGPSTNWKWYFGDGDSSTLFQPNHLYLSTGPYTVCLIMYDTITSCTDSVFQSVMATANCETFFYYFNTIVPNAIRFSGVQVSISQFPSYAFWDFGDGSYSDLRIVTHTYSTVGTYNVCFEAYDSSVNCFCSQCQNVIVSNYEPHTKISVCDGAWHNPGTWNTISIPTPDDTVLVYNQVSLDSNVTMSLTGLIYVDTLGSLCGHDTVQGGIIQFGPVYVDWFLFHSLIESWSDFSVFDCLYGWGADTGSAGFQALPSSFPFNCAPPNSCLTSSEDLIINSDNVILYPNPTSGTFTLSYNSKFSTLNSQLHIYDVMGREVYTQAINNSTQSTINISQLSNGVYFYQLTNGVDTYRGKIVKQ